MRKLWVCVLLVGLCALVAAKDKKPKPASFTGWIADVQCARTSADKAVANHGECARKCAGSTGELALVTDADHKVYDIDNDFIVRGMEGQKVSILAEPGLAPASLKIINVQGLD